eukprot:snap_masked-scaffold_5-processed-gene-1.42-mRNA-1 protein AED:1.00 eAED:1.00 QI:0/-1/0/0/-1/1/1/0/59
METIMGNTRVLVKDLKQCPKPFKEFLSLVMKPERGVARCTSDILVCRFGSFAELFNIKF